MSRAEPGFLNIDSPACDSSSIYSPIPTSKAPTPLREPHTPSTGTCPACPPRSTSRAATKFRGRLPEWIRGLGLDCVRAGSERLLQLKLAIRIAARKSWDYRACLAMQASGFRDIGLTRRESIKSCSIICEQGVSIKLSKTGNGAIMPL